MAITINRKDFDDFEDYVKHGRGCATKIPNPIEIFRVDEEIFTNRARRVLFDSLSITVKFIHLTYGANGQITKDQRIKQIDVLNKAYEKVKIEFDYNENDVVFEDNYSWYYMGHRSVSEREVKSALSNDARKFLNFYTGGLQSGLLGWATFPFDLAGDPVMDGVVMLDESLPGGDAAPYNLGKTAVHEVGHWLGLYHTFQDGCDEIGDHVNDTPAHRNANYGKPEKNKAHNACKTGEFAPIHNYMNYVDDDWMDEFTEKQMVRIKEQVLMYRTGLLTNQQS